VLFLAQSLTSSWDRESTSTNGANTS
jgi:hypothetical protein